MHALTKLREKFPEDAVFYGAKPVHGGASWAMVTDPIEFVLTADDMVIGATLEEIEAALNERESAGAADLLSWYVPNPWQKTFDKVACPTLAEGADPFAAARACPDTAITIPHALPAPEGADAASDPSSYHWNAVNALWVHEGMVCGQQNPRRTAKHDTHWILYTEDPGLLADYRKQIQAIRRRVKSRDRAAKRESMYTTIPAAKARKAFSLARSALTYALERSLGSSHYFRVRISYDGAMNKDTSRDRVLILVLSLLQAWKAVGGSVESSSDMQHMLQIFQPLHDNWEAAKNKEDAEHVEPILAILWPDGGYRGE